MLPNTEATRLEHITPNLSLSSVNVDASCLTKILLQANQQPSSKGWGKLVGFFDPETNKLHLKDSFALPPPKQDEKIRRSPVENSLGFKYKKTNLNYRFVGFYIISNGKNIFNNDVLSYFLNAETIKTPKVFLHFSTEDAAVGRSPWKFFDLADKVNKATRSFVYKESHAYDVLYSEFDKMDVKEDDLFRELDYEIEKSPIYEFLNYKYRGVYEGKLKNPPVDQLEKRLISHLENNLKQTALTMNQHMLDKNKGKKSSKVNYLGDWVRHRELRKDKEELLNGLERKLAILEKFTG